MCGLCGVAGTIRNDDTKVFNELLLLSAFRGIDSTGVAVIPRKDEPTILKATTNSFDFLDMARVKKAIVAGKQVLMGHTRWRTVGDINKANAQPFDYDKLIGTHNGTLSGDAKNLLEGKGNNFPTDSMALYYHIDKFGFEAALKLMDTKDAMALVWFSKEDNTLHMFRNDERPLWYAINDKGDTVYWASESGMLYLALNRNKIGFKKVKKLESFSHLTIKLPDKENVAFGKPKIVQLQMKAHKVPEMHVNYTTYSAKDAAEAFLGTGQREVPFARTTPGGVFTTARSAASSATSGGGKVVDLGTKMVAKWKADTLQPRSDEAGGPFYKTYNGDILNEADFDEKAKEGCALNGEIPVFGEPLKFLRDGSFLCGHCLALARSGKDAETTEAVEMML